MTALNLRRAQQKKANSQSKIGGEDEMLLLDIALLNVLLWYGSTCGRRANGQQAFYSIEVTNIASLDQLTAWEQRSTKAD